MRQIFWAVASLLENPTTAFARVMWFLIVALLAVILFVLAMRAGEGVI